jgi:uncharacterized protein (DUF433 family)
MSSVIVRDPDVMGGRPVFRGTRVPLDTLFENLEDGLSLDEILDSYPTLNRDDVVAVLHEAQTLLRAPDGCGSCWARTPPPVAGGLGRARRGDGGRARLERSRGRGAPERAEGEFDVLVTADPSLLRQQNLAGRSLAVLVLPTNRRREVLALAPALRSALADARPVATPSWGATGAPSRRIDRASPTVDRVDGLYRTGQTGAPPCSTSSRPTRPA